jgi:hypothetical protein
LILVVPQAASVSVLAIEAVVSTTIATLYCELVAPRMAAVEVVVIVNELAVLIPMAPKALMNRVGIAKVWVTWIALSPVGEAVHRTPVFATLVRHFKVVDTDTLGRLGLMLAPPVAEL